MLPDVHDLDILVRLFIEQLLERAAPQFGPTVSVLNLQVLVLARNEATEIDDLNQVVLEGRKVQNHRPGNGADAAILELHTQLLVLRCHIGPEACSARVQTLRKNIRR